MLTGFSRHKIMWDGSIVHSIALGEVTVVQYLFSSFKYNHFSYPKLWLRKVCMNCLCAQTAGTQRQTWEVKEDEVEGQVCWRSAEAEFVSAVAICTATHRCREVQAGQQGLQLCFLSSLAVEAFREVIRLYTGPNVCGQEFVLSKRSSA